MGARGRFAAGVVVVVLLAVAASIAREAPTEVTGASLEPAALPAPDAAPPPAPRVSRLRNDGAVPASLARFKTTVERQAAAHPGRFFLDGPPAPAGSRPRIALTFDDGPDRRQTAAVLDILAAEKVAATFFLVGERAARHPDLVRRMAEDGHAVGGHGHRHVDLRKLGTEEALAGQVARTNDILAEILGRRPRIHRPPYGAITDDQIVRFAEAGVITVNWSIDSYDWRPGHTAPRQIHDVTLRHAHDGAIVLFHDAGGDRSGTIAALPGIVAALREAGYSFATVPDLLGLDEPSAP